MVEDIEKRLTVNKLFCMHMQFGRKQRGNSLAFHILLIDMAVSNRFLDFFNGFPDLYLDFCMFF